VLEMAHEEKTEERYEIEGTSKWVESRKGI